ncbi:MAG TPA: hypothetical protein ENN07_02840, partial [candidate division Zixibacteria bacterium]|nr:hypothetical protein [candidate division Zixibacteria bacterium]
MRSVLLTTSLLILLVSAGFADAKMELYPPRPPASRMIVSFGELRLAVNDIDGRFTIGTTDGKPLLYGFPQEGSTSHTHFFVDDSVAGTYTESGVGRPDPVAVLAHPYSVGDAIVSRYDMRGIVFEQKLTLTTLGERTTVLIEYIATNNTLSSANVGLLLFLDTMIGENDYAPVATEFGYFASEREFISPSIPTYWQAFESSPSQPEDSLIGSGVLIGGAAAPPNRVVFGEFWNLHNTHWDYTITGDPYSDSALLMRWDARVLAPGESRRMATYYGLGTVETAVGDLTLSISGPEELFIESCTRRTPNPFPVNLLASNSTTVSMSGISAKIDLPEGFFVVTGDAIAPVTPDFLFAGEMGTVSWTVAVDDGYFAEDTTICLGVEAWAVGSDTFTVEWCISVPGIDGRGPSANLVSPSAGAIIACDTLDVMISLGEADEVNESTIELTVDGLTLGLSDPRLTYSDNILRCIVPSADLDEGNIPISLGDIRDRHDCPLIADYSWDIYLDWTPPHAEFIAPARADTVDDPTFEVTVRLDDISGIEDTSLFWIFNGAVLDLPVEFDGEFATLSPMEAGLVPLGLSSHTVCLDGIHDKVYGHCGPNFAEPICIDFWTNIVRPSAEIIEPTPESFTSCELQQIVLQMKGAGAEFDPATIALTVDGVGHSIGSSLVFDDSMLIWTPDVPFDDGAEVAISLFAETFAGLSISPLEWTFNIDLSPPTAVAISPPGMNFSTHDERIEIAIDDFGAGIDLSSLLLEITSPSASATLTADSPELHVSGGSVAFLPSDAGIALFGCDEIIVELIVADLAGYCPANTFDGEFVFNVPCSPPVYSAPSIPESSFVSCETLYVSMELRDDEGIDEEAMTIAVNGVYVELGSPFAKLEGDTLAFAIPRDDFGDTVLIAIDGVADIFGNLIDHAIELIYYFDTSPPIVENPRPAPSIFLDALPDAFAFDVFDELSGLDFSSAFVSLGGVHIDEASGLLWDGLSLSVPTDVLGAFSAESLRVCVSAADNAVACGANSTYTCWTYRFDYGAPTVQLISPPNGASIGCPDQAFEFRLSDDTGIDAETIILRAFHRDWTIADAELSFDGEMLSFSPDLSLYRTGETCAVF